MTLRSNDVADQLAALTPPTHRNYASIRHCSASYNSIHQYTKLERSDDKNKSYFWRHATQIICLDCDLVAAHHAECIAKSGTGDGQPMQPVDTKT
jgi:hypothetical protein